MPTKESIKSPVKRKRLTPTEQHARFVEAAKKSGADERPEAFDNVIKKIARAKPAAVRSRPKRSSS
jgi:hypothetical protein